MSSDNKIDRKDNSTNGIKDEIVKTDEIVMLNVGGVLYTTTRSTLLRPKNSLFTGLLSGKLGSLKDDQNRLFIDRNGEVFKWVLEWMRSSSKALTLLSEKELEMLRIEADFYCLDILVIDIKSRIAFKKEIRYKVRFVNYRSDDLAKFCQKIERDIQNGWSLVGGAFGGDGCEIGQTLICGPAATEPQIIHQSLG
jgi:hypothetical protein